jgi:hypothetical protein
MMRGCHPLRWFLCLAGLLLTGSSAAVLQACLDQTPIDLPAWQRQPTEQTQALGNSLGSASLGGLVVGAGPWLAVNGILWCLIGGWIARHELLARRRSYATVSEAEAGPNATAFVAGWWQSLLAGWPTLLVFALIMLLPALLFGSLVALGSGGALLTAILLPVVLIADLILLFVALGAVAWPLMPVTVAAECSDVFDSISRCYSYVFQTPVRFVLLTAFSLALAALPLAIAVPIVAQTMEGAQTETQQVVHGLAVALGLSIFWSVQPLLYLHLRTVIDAVDANELAMGRPTPPAKTEAVGTNKKPTPDPVPDDPFRFVRRTMMMLAVALGSWLLTVWLFTRAGEATWLHWGLGDNFMPEVSGMYQAASLIAGFWGAIWLAMPILIALRRLRAGDDRPR